VKQLAIPENNVTAKHCRVACFAPRDSGIDAVRALFRGMVRVFQHCDEDSTLARLALSGLGIRNTYRQASSACRFMLPRRFAASTATVQRNVMPYNEEEMELSYFSIFW
jgi:hypothetical protein